MSNKFILHFSSSQSYSLRAWDWSSERGLRGETAPPHPPPHSPPPPPPLLTHSRCP